MADIDSDDDISFYDSKTSLNSESRRSSPKFNEKSRIFELDYVDRLRGRVCLVYKNTRSETPAGANAEIWFLDRSLSWHFLAPNFTTFFRLMVLHLGLPEWHFLLSRVAISNKARQWFNFFAPTRLVLSENRDDNNENPNSIFETQMFSTKFDANKVFKSKSVRTAKTGGVSSGATSTAVQRKKMEQSGRSGSTGTTGQGYTPVSAGSNTTASSSTVKGSSSQRTTSAGAGASRRN